jgi:hypothetical protein
MGNLVLAAFLLTAEPGFQDPLPTEQDWPEVSKSLQSLAIQWEILDERETSYILTKRDEFHSDLNMLRQRRIQFADAPRLAEHLRLPERQAANELIRLNRDYRKHLEDRRILEQDRAHALFAAIRETDQLYIIWDAVRDARCEFYYVTVRRHALKKIRDTLGDAAYFAGELPPALPIWRMSTSR